MILAAAALAGLVLRTGNPSPSHRAAPSAPLLTEARLVDGALEVKLGRSGESATWFDVDSGSPTSYFTTDGDSPFLGAPFVISVGSVKVATVIRAPDEGPAGFGENGEGGLLGADFLRQVVLSVDIHSKTAAIWPRASFAERDPCAWSSSAGVGAGTKTVPVALRLDDDGLPIIRDFKFGRASQGALFDTGTGFCLLPKATLSAIPHHTLIPMSMQGWERTEPATSYLISSVSAGGWTSEFPVVLAMDGDQDDAILGENVLGDLTWALDLAGRKLWLRGGPKAVDGAEYPLAGAARLHVGDRQWQLDLPSGYSLPAGRYPVVRFDALEVADATGAPLTRLPREGDTAFEARRLDCYGERVRRFFEAFEQAGEKPALDVWVLYQGRRSKISLAVNERS